MAEGAVAEGRGFLSMLPPRPGERRLAGVVVIVSALLFAAAVPFANLPLARIDAFIPAYQSALVINDLITAVMLYGQFTIVRSRGLLVLASAYLFTACMVLVHTLSFPGVFAPTGVIGGGAQTTAWLYQFWHGGFPLLVIVYAMLRPDRMTVPGGAILGSVATTLAAVVGFALLATWGYDLLPQILAGIHYTPIAFGVIGTTCSLSLVALAVLWFRRPRAVLDLWLMVVMCAWVFDIALSGVLNGGRYDLGFYVGRVYGLAAASFVLLVLLLETRSLYARLVRAAQAERAEADRRAGALALANRALRDSEFRLRQLNETLEQRVAERTAALTAEIAARERAQEIQHENQKLEAIGRIAGGIAHDFNNLLTVIQGNAGLLRQTATAERDQQAAHAIHQAGERGARLIRQIMTFSRRQALKPEVIDLKARGPEMSELLNRSLRGDIRLLITLADGLWPVECDATELELALMNLCVNARDAMPEGGLVRIDGRNRSIGGEESDSLRLAGDFVVLSVTDTGSGIASEDLARVFEPFFTTKKAGEGTGLGLSQVYGFAQAAGGRALIASQQGVGTAVTLYLPRAAIGAETAPAEATPETAKGAGAVLLVEDDDDVATVVANMLQMIGYSAHRARDARTALALLLGGQRFDLVFSDIMMPGGMSGLELARKVRQHFPDLPILLASGYNRAAAEVDREGFNLIAKPFRADALSDALRETLAQRSRGARSA